MSGSNNEEGSEMRTKGQYKGNEKEMTLRVTSKSKTKSLLQNQHENHLKDGKVQSFKEMEQILHI